MNNMDIYDRARQVPEAAQKRIGGGRLKGMTDINPMWRIQMLTELFGPCGFGWYYQITDKHIEEGANGERAAIVDIDLYIKDGSEWSKAIPGTGGSMLISNEKGGAYTSDEAYKMALTDAISVACKALGFGADVYWQAGRTKYSARTDANTQEAAKKQADPYTCESCGGPIRNEEGINGDLVPASEIIKLSVARTGKHLCGACLKKADAAKKAEAMERLKAQAGA